MNAVEVSERWHPAPGTRYFAIGDEVRLDGERGSCYRIRSFGDEGGRPVVELYGQKRAGGPTMVRTVYAERLRRR